MTNAHFSGSSPPSKGATLLQRFSISPCQDVILHIECRDSNIHLLVALRSYHLHAMVTSELETFAVGPLNLIR